MTGNVMLTLNTSLRHEHVGVSDTQRSQPMPKNGNRLHTSIDNSIRNTSRKRRPSGSVLIQRRRAMRFVVHVSDIPNATRRATQSTRQLPKDGSLLNRVGAVKPESMLITTRAMRPNISSTWSGYVESITPSSTASTRVRSSP